MTLTERRELVESLTENLKEIYAIAMEASMEHPELVALEHRIGRALIDFELLTTATVDELGECAAVLNEAKSHDGHLGALGE